MRLSSIPRKENGTADLLSPAACLPRPRSAVPLCLFCLRSSQTSSRAQDTSAQTVLRNLLRVASHRRAVNGCARNQRSRPASPSGKASRYAGARDREDDIDPA